MAYPAVGTLSEGNSGISVTESVVTLPTLSAGDGCIVFFTVDGVHTLTLHGDTTAGWSILAQTSASATVTGAVLWLNSAIGGGSDVLKISHGSERSLWVCYPITGHDTSTAPDSGTPNTGSGANSDPPSVTPSGGSLDYLFFASRHGDSVVNATAAPTNYANLKTANYTSGGALDIARRELTTGSAENPDAFTVATEEWATFTTCIHPAAAGGGPTGPPAGTLALLGVGA